MYKDLETAINSEDDSTIRKGLTDFIASNSDVVPTTFKYVRDTKYCSLNRIKGSCETEDSLEDVVAHAKALLGFLSVSLPKEIVPIKSPQDDNDQ